MFAEEGLTPYRRPEAESYYEGNNKTKKKKKLRKGVQIYSPMNDQILQEAEMVRNRWREMEGSKLFPEEDEVVVVKRHYYRKQDAKQKEAGSNMNEVGEVTDNYVDPQIHLYYFLKNKPKDKAKQPAEEEVEEKTEGSGNHHDALSTSFREIMRKSIAATLAEPNDEVEEKEDKKEEEVSLRKQLIFDMPDLSPSYLGYFYSPFLRSEEREQDNTLSGLLDDIPGADAPWWVPLEFPGIDSILESEVCPREE